MNKYISAGKASEMAGISKATICRALKNGTLNHVSRNSYGYKIDPQEIIRVYGHPEPKKSDTPTKNNPEKEILELKIQHLKEKNEDLIDQNEELRKEKEDWKKLAFSQLEKI